MNQKCLGCGTLVALSKFKSGTAIFPILFFSPSLALNLLTERDFFLDCASGPVPGVSALGASNRLVQHYQKFAIDLWFHEYVCPLIKRHQDATTTVKTLQSPLWNHFKSSFFKGEAHLVNTWLFNVDLILSLFQWPRTRRGHHYSGVNGLHQVVSAHIVMRRVIKLSVRPIQLERSQLYDDILSFCTFNEQFDEGLIFFVAMFYK